MRVSAGAMLARVRKLEQSHVSPLLKFIGSVDAWGQCITDAIEDGRICKRDGPMLFNAVRRWIDVPYATPHGTLAPVPMPATVRVVERSIEAEAASAPVVNTQAEHERLYQEYRRALPEGSRAYLRDKEEQVRRATTR